MKKLISKSIIIIVCGVDVSYEAQYYSLLI